MKKSVLPLAIVTAVLVGLVLLRNASNTPESIVDQVQLARLTPENTTEADIARVELYAGNDAETKLVMARNADNAAQWIVTSNYDAPVKEDKITEFLEELATLRGELRTTVENEEALDDYALTEENALHVAAYGKEGEEPLFHVLVGKSPDYKSVFMRQAGGLDVFVEDSNLRSTAGLFGEELKAPEAKTWLDTKVLEYAEDDIVGIDVTTPTKSLTFAYETPEPETSEAEGEEGEEAPPTPPAIPEWKLTAGGPGLPLKTSGVTALVTKLGNLAAADIVDPSKLEEYGLNAPGFSLAVTLKDQEKPVVIEGARKDPDGPGYIRIAGQENAHVYEVAKYNFEGLFPKGSTFFDLPKTAIDGDVETMTIVQPEGAISFKKEGEEWIVEDPASPLPLQDTTLTSAAGALKTWAPADYADPGADTGIGSGNRSVTFTAKGFIHTLELGKDDPASGGTFVKVGDSNVPIIMSKSDVSRIFKPRKDYFQLSLVDLTEADIDGVTITQGGNETSLQRADGQWSITSNGAPVEGSPDIDAIEVLAVAISELQASEVAFGQAELGGEPFATVQVAGTSGQSYTINLGGEVEGGRAATLAGTAQVVHIAQEDVDALLPDAQSLIRQPNEEDPAADTEESAEEAPESDDAGDDSE